MALHIEQKFSATLDNSEVELAIANHVRANVEGMIDAKFDVRVIQRQKPTRFEATVTKAVDEPAEVEVVEPVDPVILSDTDEDAEAIAPEPQDSDGLFEEVD